MVQSLWLSVVAPTSYASQISLESSIWSTSFEIEANPGEEAIISGYISWFWLADTEGKRIFWNSISILAEP